MTEAKSNAPSPDLEVAIIGAGFAGLCVAVKLKQAGLHDFRVFESEDDVGGTWLVNTYPGCACDIPSHLYSYSFAPNPDWSRAFSPQPEIWAYLRRVANDFALYPYIRLGTRIERARYDDETGCWRLSTSDGEQLTARVLVSAMGGLSVPSYPELPGRARFAGASFHSQRWDHDFDLSGKTVAVVGTGASAIQFVPEIAPRVARLHLFQRTPPWVIPRPDHAVPQEARALYRRVPLAQRLIRRAIYTKQELRAIAFVFKPQLLKLASWLGRTHIARQVADPALRAKLTPSYTLGCKRVLMSNDYYPALCRDNVELVTDGIREVTPRGLVTQDGRTREVDAIIYGTGFRAFAPVPRGVVFGRGGLDIVDAWAEGPEAYKGTAVAGFPNMFVMTGPNTGLGHNSMVYMIESQVPYILDALRTIQRRRLKAVAVRPDAQRRYNAWLQRRMRRTVWSTGGCVSWYMDGGGKNVTLWPGFTFGFRHMLRRFDARAYELIPRDAASA
ncbi:MAG: NAD(P)/FAD-dependent oxidoreductase [Myxococcales bacterium]|nr:NAD(P)/FAD-dependent oxidoreductase [Myxococcales bacterium]